ncbi:MAG: DUF1318 domain-containing protein [Candidatus Omnitrophota bacterium]
MTRQRKRAGLIMKATMALLFLLGCARVTVDSKQPIKVDVTMRLDIYQHVAKDVTAIEDMISAPIAGQGKTSFLFFGVDEAYAQEESDFPSDVMAAIELRKTRRNNLVIWEEKGAIGEGADGFVVVRDISIAEHAYPSYAEHVLTIVEEENRDRKIIYEYVSNKNGAAQDETGRLFAKRIQADAPQGTPIEAPDGSWNTR